MTNRALNGTLGYNRSTSDRVQESKLNPSTGEKIRTVDESAQILHVGDDFVRGTSVGSYFFHNLLPQLLGDIRSLGEDIDTEGEEGGSLKYN